MAGQSNAARTSDGAVLSRDQFRAFSDKIHALTGIVLKEHKLPMMQARLNKRLLALDLPDFQTYTDLVIRDGNPEETNEFINALTTNLTSFFRESHHFDHLADEIVSPLIGAGAKRMRIWSSACSTGEEPYSIMMTLDRIGALSTNVDCKLLATDLDSNVLNRASQGLYDASRLKDVPHAILKSTTTQAADGRVQMSERIRAHMTFNRLNLLEKWPINGPFDAIFCRNVLIYFDAEAKASIVDRFSRLLAPHGALYLGHSESLLGEHPILTSLGRTIYRRRA